MKTWITVLCAVAVMAGCAKTDVPKVVVEDPDVVDAPSTVVKLSQLQDRNGVYYLPNESKPFTGVAVGKYKNEQKRWERTFKDGKYHGLSTHWYPNGQKYWESNFKNGKMHGRYTGWHENGQKHWERTFKEGKRDGLFTGWHKNGQKEEEVTWKDNKKISYKEWDEEGNPE